MLLKLILAPIWSLISFLLGFFPDAMLSSLFGSSGFLENIYFGINFIGEDMFTLIINNGVFWICAHLTWSVVDFIINKIPGVN